MIINNKTFNEITIKGKSYYDPCVITKVINEDLSPHITSIISNELYSTSIGFDIYDEYMNKLSRLIGLNIEQIRSTKTEFRTLNELGCYYLLNIYNANTYGDAYISYINSR